MKKNAPLDTPTAGPPNRIRRATAADARGLSELARKAFYEAFKSDTAPEDLRAYVNTHFRTDLQLREIADPSSVVLMAFRDARAAGFAHLRASPPPFHAENLPTVQLKRLYLRAAFWGTGMGARLMQRSLQEAAAAGYRLIWLSCWENNRRALSFYRQWHFKPSGYRKFRVGRDAQQDVILSRPL
jgi:GNAT superfamily N-acetyltransferase